MAERDWPLVVRRARADDQAAVLTFASRTWDGWDYIPNAWPHWLAAADGVLLVATAGRAPDGSPPRDADGTEIPADRPIAVARVAMSRLTVTSPRPAPLYLRAPDAAPSRDLLPTSLAG